MLKEIKKQYFTEVTMNLKVIGVNTKQEIEKRFTDICENMNF